MATASFEGRMLRIHIGEDDRWQDKPLCEALVYRCLQLGIENVTVYRGLEGFGTSAKVHHARTWPFSKEAPIMISVIDTEPRIQELLPHLDAMVSEGLVAISAVEVIRYASVIPEASHPPLLKSI